VVDPTEKRIWAKPSKKKTFKPKESVGLGNGPVDGKPSHTGPHKLLGWQVLHEAEGSTSVGPIASRRVMNSDLDCPDDDSDEQGLAPLATVRMTDMNSDIVAGDGSCDGSKDLTRVSPTVKASVFPESSGGLGHVDSLSVRLEVIEEVFFGGRGVTEEGDIPFVSSSKG
jgi:hypothetical protein